MNFGEEIYIMKEENKEREKKDGQLSVPP